MHKPNIKAQRLTALFMLGAALVFVTLFRKLGLGATLGYIVGGAVIGPYALGLIGDPEAVMRVSEIGIAFLLFGYLTERKGPLMVLDALRLLPQRIAARVAVLFAGRWQPSALAGRRFWICRMAWRGACARHRIS